MVVGCPFDVFELPHQHWFQQAAFLHLIGGEALPPAAASRLWQVHERTLRDLQTLQATIQLVSSSRREPIAGSCGIQKPVTFVVSEDQGVKVTGAGSIPSNHKLLTLADPHLAPGTRALARFVFAVQTLRNKVLKFV